jgi:hypothetical protein
MKRILILFACLLPLASCYAPVDLSLSQAVAVLRNPDVTYRATIGPIGDSGGFDGTAELTFLPSKISTPPGIDFKSGFTVMRGATRTLVRYAANNDVFGWWGADYVNSQPAYDAFLIEPLKSFNGTDDPLGCLDMNQDTPSARTASTTAAHIPTREFPFGRTDVNITGSVQAAMSYDSSPIGFSIFPSDLSQTFDRAYWLLRKNGTLELIEITMELNSTGFSTLQFTKAGLAEFDVPELGDITRCNYFFDPGSASLDADRMSYASWYDAATSTWKCVSWKGMPVVSTLLTRVTHRVDALLTNGMLFSTEGGVGRLYDSGGTQQAEFPLGALRFVGERYVDGIPAAVFSLAHRTVENYQTTFSIDVYTVETAKLLRL